MEFCTCITKGADSHVSIVDEVYCSSRKFQGIRTSYGKVKCVNVHVCVCVRVCVCVCGACLYMSVWCVSVYECV